MTDRYAQLLKSLLPPGPAWANGAGEIFSKTLESFSEELKRLEERALELLVESDPRTSDELLSDWERIVRIPDDCQDVSSNLAQRRADVLRKLATRGGQNAAFYIELASKFGYAVTIENCVALRSGRGRCGDRLYSEDFAHTWRVVSPNVVPVYMRAGSSVGSLLAEYEDDLLECVIRAAAPAHSNVLFTYGGS